jgi:hypothetical protein
MTKKIKAHSLFAVWRADEVAECLHVSEEAYQHLWNVIVPLQPKPRQEQPTYEYPLRNYWSQVPPAMRKELNQAADQYEAEYRGEVSGNQQKHDVARVERLLQRART